MDLDRLGFQLLMNIRFTKTLVTLVAPLCATVGHTNAEEQPTQTPATVEEIQVYSTKSSRSEELQEVPASITAFSASTLSALQFNTLEDISFAAPNVTLDQIGSSPGIQNFSIRGLGINTSIPSVDPTVGVFVDGIYLGVSTGVVLDTMDLESLEILRGPQGLLFGRNVTGGAVLLRTKRPDEAFGASAKFGYETGPQFTTSAAVEGSLAPGKLAGKLSILHKDDDGYFENFAQPDRDVGQQRTVVLRPTLVFTPTEDLNVTAIFEHGDVEGDGATPQRLLPGSTLAAGSNIDTAIDEVGTTEIKWDQLTIETTMTRGFGTVTNLFGYRRLDQTGVSDIDASPLSLFRGEFLIEQDQISNELRYSGSLSDKISLTAGLYYFEQNILYRENRTLLFGSVVTGLGGDQDHRNLAAFASTNIQLTDDFELALGARYTNEKKSANVTRIGLCDINSLICDEDFSDSEAWSNVSPKVALQWTGWKNALLYGHWTQGFRSGGYNFRTTLPDVFPPGPTDEEKQSSFEIGFKSSWLDRRAVFNGAVFWNDLSNLQRETSLANPDVGVVQGIRNTADATIKGVEFDLTALPLSNLALRASVGYLDGQYDEVRLDLNGDGLVDEADAGLTIPRLPRWTIATGFTLNYDLERLGVLSLRGDYGYRAPIVVTDNNFGALPSYDVFNASVSLRSDDERWTFTAYGKNLSDEAIAQSVTPLPFGALGAPRFSPIQKGRRWGVELSFLY